MTHPGLEIALLSAIAAQGGVARSAALVREGHRPRTIAALVGKGLLRRIRRVWVALPEAEPLLQAAARTGTVISCVTQARRLGLWVADQGPPHVAARPDGARLRVAAGTVVHWAKPVVPRPPGVLVDAVENVLALIGTCQPQEAALATIESALSHDLVDRSALLRVPLTARVRTLVEEASPWADSGLETFFVRRLRWLRLPIRVQIWIAGHRVDTLIGDRLVVQIDGGHHVGPQRTSDIRHDAALMLLGYHVIRVGYDQIVNRWAEVQDQVMRAVAQGLHRAA